jgi:hypothetical protein
MTIRNISLKYGMLSAIFIVILSSCIEQNMITGSGVLKGKISIGPLCPVERIPPDPACQPTMETYKAWAIAVWSVDKKSKLATLAPKLDGTYQIGLPSGDYSIDFDVARTNTIGSDNLPTTISIANMDTTIFNVNIDTGIR